MWQHVTISLRVADATGDAVFTLFGHVAESLLNISANDLCQVYSPDASELPQQIERFRGCELTFEIQLAPPPNQLGGFSDYRVNIVFGFQKGAPTSGHYNSSSHGRSHSVTTVWCLLIPQ